VENGNDDDRRIGWLIDCALNNPEWEHVGAAAKISPAKLQELVREMAAANDEPVTDADVAAVVDGLKRNQAAFDAAIRSQDAKRSQQP